MTDEWAEKRAKWVAERAVAENWKRHGMVKPVILAAMSDAAERERQSVLDRLRNPDEALVEALMLEVERQGILLAEDSAPIVPAAVCRALAATLDEKEV